jgi:serine/threonine protein kinase
MYKCALRVTRTCCLHPPFIQSFRPPRNVCFSTSTRVSSTARPELANQHSSADPEGKQVANLALASQVLGMPVMDGHGWAQFEFGDQIGQDNRYTIARKLGRGMYSNTWLARDSMSVYCQFPFYSVTPSFNSDNKFVAVKVLTGHMTDMHRRGVVCEATVLQLISRLPISPHCVQLLDEFTIPGKGTVGPHMCFVMPVYGGDVRALAMARESAFPLPLVKRIVLHLLRGIVHTHGHGVVHTDLKHDNIFFSTTMTADDIEAWMTKEPSRQHAPEASPDGAVQTEVAQPLPMISEDDAMRATYLLADFGSGICFLSNFFDSDTHNGLQRNHRTSTTTSRSHRSPYDHRRHTLGRNGTSPRTFGLSVV